MKEEKRQESRLKFRINIQYEKVLEDGSFGIPIAVPAVDISFSSMSFYAPEELKLNTKVCVSFPVSEKEKVSYIGVIQRMEITDEDPPRYLVIVRRDEVGDAVKEKLDRFISDINIYNILDKINLSDIVDIHFVAGYPPVVRRQGRLSFEKSEALETNVLKILLLSILNDTRYKKFMEEKEANFVFHYREDARFRVNLHVQRGKIEATFRLIPHKIKLPQELGLPPVVDKLLENTKGLILISGRTGSGKTTTLSGMIEVLNEKREGVIVCIEDPVEYIHTNKKCIIKQREVGSDTLSFSNAAKNALRQGPDILVIGEILDAETMDVAITAAETGVLVLSTIHGADTTQALSRITSFYPEEAQKHVLSRLSFALKGIIVQELLPRIDKDGFIVASEIVVVNDAMKRTIRQGDWRQIPTIIQTNKAVGMQSMQDSLEDHVRYGQIDNKYLSDYKL